MKYLRDKESIEGSITLTPRVTLQKTAFLVNLHPGLKFNT